MDIVAMQAAFILGGTSFIGKFVKDPDERDVVLPIVACLLGVLSACYFGGWNVDIAIQGAILGGTTTGLYAVATRDGRPKSVPVRDGNANQ